MWLFSSVRHWGTYNYIAGLYDDLDPTALVLYARSEQTGRSPRVARQRRRDGSPSRRRLGTESTPTITRSTSDFGTCLRPNRADGAFRVRSQQERPPVVRPGELELAGDQRVLLEAGATITVQSSTGRRNPARAGRFVGHHRLVHELHLAGADRRIRRHRNNQSNYRARRLLGHGHARSKVGLTLMQQWRVVGNDRQQRGELHLLSTACPTRLTQFAEPADIPRTRELQPGPVRAGPVDAQSSDAQCWARARIFSTRRWTPSTSPRVCSLAARDVSEGRERAQLAATCRHASVSRTILLGTGRTALKATLARYVRGESYTIARAVNPLQSTVSSTSRNWNDTSIPSGTAS